MKQMKSKRLTKEFMQEFNDYDFSKIKEKTIFLVGSNTRAKDYFSKIESILQIKFKKLVSICSIDGLLHKEKFSPEEWAILQEIALKKLNLHEAILVLDVDGYIGDHSREEIETCNNLNKKVYYLSNLK
ncbi:MAG: hypothetical protein EU549_04325 [Promethearchaeota archaeon]|nr:MAG: hypothetical protein EU549_04325 [Candidatus Lokiarchaeota archaeon]